MSTLALVALGLTLRTSAVPTGGAILERLERWILATTKALRFTLTQRTRGLRLAGLLSILGWTLFWAISGTTSSLARGLGNPVGLAWRWPAGEAAQSGGWRGPKNPAKVVPLWRLNVGALGYTPWRVRENEIENGVSIGQLHFLSNESLLVTFVLHIVPETLPRRGALEGPSNLQLKALFIDAVTGHVRASHEWPTFSERSRILPVGRGMFVAVTPDKLTLYSSSIQPLKELSIPVGREAIKTWWDAIPSPGGNRLMISYDPPGGDWVHPPPRMFTLIDTATLHVASVWGERIGRGHVLPYGSLDDGEILALNQTGTGNVIGPPPNGPWRPVAIPWRQGCQPSGFLIALSDSVLFGGNSVSVDRWCYSLALTNGQILFERELPDKEFVGLVGVSTGGQRFAVETYKMHGGSWLLDIGGHALVYRIKVYDIPARRWIYALNGKKQGIKTISGLALSPDGSLLALINQDGILEVYRIAATPISPR